ncbi:hypothetical protein WICMUC_004472 [Wickerhamomyces mucosus]|uniref:Protein RMD9, mitochondrial n=1 Tax=Wickerhamomyces mucosus TaxID=1378264 RepID=A0A9P8PHH5_9ASCO|nr:hypothetical protein WICMUC_004472 [Wickerhamomyces mucosus]
MFRLTTQSNVLKARLTNQVVRTARDSINHSIRFNSVAIERTPSQDLNNTNNSSTQNNFSFSSTVKQVADLNKQVNSQQKKNGHNNNNRKNSQHNHQNSFQINRSSPWYNQLSALQECLLDASNLTESSGQLFFWDSLKKAMVLYEEIKGVPDFDSRLTGSLVHALHTGLRANRSQLTRLSKKPDYDQNSFHNELNIFIKNSLRTISNDLLNNVVLIDDNGAMHLLTCLKELKLDNEAISIWSSSMELEHLKFIFLQPKVVGVLLPMMYQLGSNYSDLENLFQQSNSLNGKKPTHPFLLSGIIKTSLAAKEHEKSLFYYNELLDHPSKSMTISSLIDVHLAFIGESKDIEIANIFFNKAINKEMPYKLTLQVNNVKQFLSNIWLETGDFNKVLDIWIKSTKFYGRNINHGISSSLNNKFFEIFFEKFNIKSDEGLLTLKKIIGIYNDLKPIDEPFFNIIISKCIIWGDKETIDSLYNAYGLYNLQKTQVSRRIYLKSLGSIEISNDEEILNAWEDLIKFNDLEGYDYIANADWAALRDSTIASIYKRNEIYYKIWLNYKKYCRNFDQFKRISNNLNLFNEFQPILNKDQNFNKISLPIFKNLKSQQF